MPEGSGQLLVVALIIVIGYLLLIRPARRRAREVNDIQAALSPGDEVMLTSGIFGRVSSVAEEKVDLEIAPGTVISVHRGAVGKVVVDVPDPDAEDDTDYDDETAIDSETDNDDLDSDLNDSPTAEPGNQTERGAD